MEILNKAGPKDKVFDFDLNQICAFTGNRPVRLFIPKRDTRLWPLDLKNALLNFGGEHE